MNKAKISRQMTVASAKKHSTPSRNQQEQQEQKDKEVIDAESRGATAANRLYQDGARSRKRRENLVKKAAQMKEEEMKRAHLK